MDILERNDIPSWLTSWIAWRNYYTNPGDRPFADLMKELGTGSFLGLSLAYNQKHKVCPHCGDQYVVIDKKWGVIYCICQVLEYQEKQFYKFDGIRSEAQPAYLRDLKTDNVMQSHVGNRTLKEAIKVAEQFVKTPDKWLVLSGYYGTGKTHILRALNASLYPMSVYVASRDLEDMVHRYRKEDNLGELYSKLRYAPVLLLDDFGMEYGGPLMYSMIDRIVDARYARFPEYPLVITTNLKEYEFLDNDMTARTGDRMQDRDKVLFVPLEGKSYREIGSQG